MKNKLRRCGCGCGEETNLDAKGRPSRFRRGHNRRLVGSKGWIEQGHSFICVNGRRRALHRVIVEEREGRTLGRHEVVHHVDFNPLNNDADNLVVLSLPEHTRLHMLGKQRRWAGEEKQRAVDLYQSGMNVDEVARALGRPYSSTRDILAAGRVLRTPAETRRLRRLRTSRTWSS